MSVVFHLKIVGFTMLFIYLFIFKLLFFITLTRHNQKCMQQLVSLCMVDGVAMDVLVYSC